MRVASFNVLHGLSLEDGRADGARLAAACAELAPDVLALQEVDRFQPRSGCADQPALVAEAVGAVDYRFVPSLMGTPGGPWRPATDADPVSTHPAYGVALFSRLPVTRWATVRLPRAPRAGAPMRSAASGRWAWVADEPRVAVVARVAAPFGEVTVAAAHLSFVPAWNAWQLRRLLAALRRLPGPYLLIGDLNLPGSLPQALCRWTPLVRGRTFPAPEPRMQLDHVLASPGLVGGRAWVVYLPVSDHRAVVAEVSA